MKWKRGLVTLLVLAIAMPTTFAIGRALRLAFGDGSQARAKRPAVVSGERPAVVSDERADSFDARAETATRLVSVLPGSPDTPAAEAAQARRRVQARRTVEGLLSRVNSTVIPGSVPELIANVNRGFLTGWLDAIRHTSSELLDGIAEDLRERICRDPLAAEEAIIFGHVFQLAPEVSSAEAFECFFTRFPAEEVPLWTMLDAWRNTGMDPVPALARIQTAALDPRTRSRFEPLE
jgi:hypothetical protein